MKTNYLGTDTATAAISASGPSSMGFISDVSRFASAAAGTTPTVSELVNASNAEYSTSGTPAGMTAFMVNGSQLTITDNSNGLSAKVWVTDQKQIIIAYQGTTGGNYLFTDPAITISQIASDIGVYGKTVTSSETEALSFAQTVEKDAAKQGISSSNVFVTGHSLGGIEAEYVAQQTGLGGLALEATGLPSTAAAGATGKNFVNIVTYGDPVGNYSSDIKGEQPFAPSTGLNHYGNIVMVGDPADQATLSSTVANWDPNNIITGTGIVLNLAGLLLDYHLPDTQAHDLGVTLNLNNIADDIGNTSGPVINVANLTVPQLIAGYATHAHVA